jgi:hypothetical protein
LTSSLEEDILGSGDSSMPHHYTRKAQVPFTEEQYLALMSIARQEHKPLATLIREATDLVYFQKKRNPGKARAVRSLLSLKETEVPADYQGSALSTR